MKQSMLFLLAIAVACHPANNQNTITMEKTLSAGLPTIGILIFDGFLSNEIVAPIDVFSKKDSLDQTLFNVVLIADEDRHYISEEGLKVIPDFTITNSPMLTVLVIPSSMNPDEQVKDSHLIEFIKEQSRATDYIASHCAGAFLLGESGVADGKKIVTYCGGSQSLQQDYPSLLVQDDHQNSVIQDGKIISSNGNLVSYLASLDLLELMSSTAHRHHVENELLIHKLK
ncbi:DJ-1/PfpI family protein [Fulvivirga sp.]|uniref:DJ-1/PfpI family protein n=1 Tax=Fulvivirga sp. TaxID=1931237 RepID=UPI0032ED42F1